MTEGEMKEDREKWMIKARERQTGDRGSRTGERKKAMVNAGGRERATDFQKIF